MPLASLTIGRLAKAAEVNVETIRYYQRVGLLTEPAKPYNGFRVYPDETINRIRFIKRAQKLGFRLKDIAHLLDLSEGHCDDVREQAEAKLMQIEAQIKDLQSMRKTLKKLVSECSAGNGKGDCPIVQSLTENSSKKKGSNR
ncbi:MAG TPA: Hg(II)-responsive transcriptional regulator [Gammaproteobacteria bacterium]|nr:Hg(II)-responsive transcriptional regulator [Gammaproteobacteria bacterium]